MSLRDPDGEIMNFPYFSGHVFSSKFRFLKYSAQSVLTFGDQLSINELQCRDTGIGSDE